MWLCSEGYVEPTLDTAIRQLLTHAEKSPDLPESLKETLANLRENNYEPLGVVGVESD